MYYMRSPLTGHLFLLLGGSFAQWGQRWLVPATQIHLCGGHEGQIFDLTALLGLLFAREHSVPLCARPQGQHLLRGLLTAQLSLVGRARRKLCFLGTELRAFAPRFLPFYIPETRLPVNGEDKHLHQVVQGQLKPLRDVNNLLFTIYQYKIYTRVILVYLYTENKLFLNI